MLPNINLTDNVEFKSQPSNTYKLNIKKNNISGFIDEINAVKQAVYLILNIERYRYLIYDWDYGFEISDLIGQDINIMQIEIQKRISDALKQDERITDVYDFIFKKTNKILHVSFSINTIFGEYTEEKSFEIA